MKVLFTAIALLISANSWAEKPALNCDLGPAKKTFGGTPWLLYGCNDKHSVVVVTDTGSPAMPFYFMFAYSNGGYQLHGEGTGNKAKTDEAYGELSKLTDVQIAHLFGEATGAQSK